MKALLAIDSQKLTEKKSAAKKKAKHAPNELLSIKAVIDEMQEKLRVNMAQHNGFNPDESELEQKPDKWSESDLEYHNNKLGFIECGEILYSDTNNDSKT